MLLTLYLLCHPPHNCSDGGSDCKQSSWNVGGQGSIRGSGRSPGEGNGNPLQYSCLENPMDRGAWQATVHGGRKESNTSEQLTFLLSADICLAQSHWPVSPSAWHALPPDSLHLCPFTAFIFCLNIIFSEWFSLTCLSKIGISNMFSLITLVHFSMSSTLSRWDEGLFFSQPLCVPRSCFITETVFSHKYLLDIWIKYILKVLSYWYSKKTLQRRYHFSSPK